MTWMKNSSEGYLSMERIKPAIIRTSEGNVTNLAHFKTSNVNRDNGVVKSPKIKRKQDVFKAVDVRI